MFEGWENFYIIIAPSAAALIGLMFVVVTLTTENEPRAMEMGSRVYITPIVCHLAVVLIIGAMAEVPHISPMVTAVILIVLGVLGVAYSAITTVRLFELERLSEYVPDFSDKLFYGIFPTLVYAAATGTGGLVLVDTRIGVYALAVVTMVLLLLAIRDAWDLVTAIVQSLAKRKLAQKTKDGSV